MPLNVFEKLLGFYSRLAPSERGGYRLSRLVRRTRPSDRWVDEFPVPAGYRMALDLGVYPDCAMAYGLYELDTARLIRRMLRPGDHFVDAGANIGYFTLLAARCVGPAGRVDAFEPQPANRQRLIEHLRLNELADRVTVHDAALTDQSGSTDFHVYQKYDNAHNHGCSSLFAPNDGAATSTITVPTVRLDEVLAGVVPRLIKLDIEGAEALAVSGMTGLLKSENPPAIVGEFNPRQSRAARIPPTAWLERVLSIAPHYRLRKVGLVCRTTTLGKLLTGGQVNVLLSV